MKKNIATTTTTKYIYIKNSHFAVYQKLTQHWNQIYFNEKKLKYSYKIGTTVILILPWGNSGTDRLNNLSQ